MWNEMKKKIKINSPKILDRRVFIRNGSGLCNWGNALTGGAEIYYQSVINSKFNLCLSVKWLLWILYCLALRLLSYRLCYLQNANICMLVYSKYKWIHQQLLFCSFIICKMFDLFLSATYSRQGIIIILIICTIV